MTETATSEQVLSMILPASISGGHGGNLVDGEGHSWLDFISAWGANLLGHGEPRVAEAVRAQIGRHANLGLAGPEFHELHSRLTRVVPCAQGMHLVKNGSDATAAAIRLARHVTGRTTVLHRGYHGAQDWYMAGCGTPGVPSALRDHIMTLADLSPETVAAALAAAPGGAACLILDPMVWPEPKAFQIAQSMELVRAAGGLVIFDEVISGFRVAPGGMQEIWGVTPDLACLGKGIANGLPLAALVGRADLLARMSAVNYSLTYGLEAVSIAAANATIDIVVEDDVPASLSRHGGMLKSMFDAFCWDKGLDARLAGRDCRPFLHFEAQDGMDPALMQWRTILGLSRRRVATYGVFSLCAAHREAAVAAAAAALRCAVTDMLAEMRAERPTQVPVFAAALADEATAEPTADAVFEAPDGAVSVGPDLSLAAAPADDPLAPDRIVWATPEEMEAQVSGLSRSELDARYGSDPWLHNILLSAWEYVAGKPVVDSLPWNLTFGITTTCNARCPSCTVPLRRTREAARSPEADDIPHLETLLRQVRYLILTGGEPTIHPRFGQFLEKIRDLADPRMYATMITHGGRLDRFRDALAAANINLTVSLNAATAATHHKLMRLGPGAFDRIVESIRHARSVGRIVDLSLFVARENIAEIPAFIALAEELDVHGIYFRTLIPGDYYISLFAGDRDLETLVPWAHPDFACLQANAVAAIAQAKVKIYGDPSQWGLRLQSAALPDGASREDYIAAVRDDPELAFTKGDRLPPGSTVDDWRRPVDNPYGRAAPFACSYPWYALKVLDTSRKLIPCGFMQHIMGHEDVSLAGADDFRTLWNSPAMVHLRRTLTDGPLLPECVTCPYQMGGEGQCQSDHAPASSWPKRELLAL
jgi:glutamate-1-semialdehyde aminotransferase/MoaA/NifB/PqqE/SkfB family radical SAM enzyme